MRLGRCMVASTIALGALSACYAPTIAPGAPCDTTTNNCPTGQTCTATSGTAGTCDGPGAGTDAGGTDVKVGSFCLGAKLAGSVCLDSAPTGDVTLSAALSTESVAAGNCTALQTQTGGGKLCVIAGDTITIATGITIHAIGANPVVLFAAHTINIQGTIDVSSHTGETFGGSPVAGAGGRTKPTDCVAVGVDGTAGSGSNGGGGAAGGSFGTQGAAGGNGRNTTGHGNPVAATAPTVLVGGCPGGIGGAGAGTGGAGTAGFGGGVIYLLAGTSITVSGSLNASGGGGGGGAAGNASSGGGGGGGGGGLIGIESPATTVSGTLFANGGGGGGGGGDDSDFGGSAGGTTMALATAATGGTGGQNGGGAGGTGATTAAAKVGGNASTNNTGTQAAGGGGGGGLGIIKIYGTPTTTGATFSPAPTST